MHQPRLLLCCGQASSHMSSLFISILGTRSLILQSIWALSHALRYLAKCHCTPRKHFHVGSHPILMWSWVTEIQASWAPTLKVLLEVTAWLWHTLGPGDTGLTGEIIMFYPSLIPLSVKWMRTDKCSDGRTHSCSIYSWSLVPGGSSFPGTIPGDQPTPRYLLPANTCCRLVKCQAALSLLIPKAVNFSRSCGITAFQMTYTWRAIVSTPPIPLSALHLGPGLNLSAKCQCGGLQSP